MDIRVWAAAVQMLRAARTRAGNVNAFMGIIIRLRKVADGLAGGQGGSLPCFSEKKPLRHDGKAFAGDEQKMMFPPYFASFSMWKTDC